MKFVKIVLWTFGFISLAVWLYIAWWII